MNNVCFKNVVRSRGRNTEDVIMIKDSTASRKYSIYNTTQAKENCACTQHKTIKSATKSSAPEASQSGSRKTCPCKSPTRSSAKTYPANSANGSSPGSTRGSTRASTNLPHAHCKIEKRSPKRTPTRNPEIQSCLTIENRVENTRSCQNICTFASVDSSAQLEEFAKNLMKTDKVVNSLKDEIGHLGHHLHHVLQQQRSAPPNFKMPRLIKVPSVPVEYNKCVNMKEYERMKQEYENVQREKEDLEEKKKILEDSWNNLLKAKDIVSQYNEKVCLLHTEVYKLLEVMELKKEMFCKCIQEKEDKIRSLEESLLKTTLLLEEKNCVFNSKEAERGILHINSLTLKENNDHLKQTMESLKHKLSDSTAEVLKQKGNNSKLKKDLSDLNHVCKELILRTKKEKESYESRIKSFEVELQEFTSKIGQLSEQLLKNDQRKNNLKNTCQELQPTIQQYEVFGNSFKQLERDCKTEHETMAGTMKVYNAEKQAMKKLIEELNDVVKQKNTTLERITEINKEQENIIEQQSLALSSKEEELKVMENETEMFKIRSECLAKEMEQLKKDILKPGKRDACLCISKELAQIWYALDAERNTYLLKEKVEADQLQNITNLRSQVKEKLPGLQEAQDINEYLELAITKINEKLTKKHQELDTQVDEKENSIDKLRILDNQEYELSDEIKEFKKILCGLQQTCIGNENQRELLKNLEQQINEQKQNWDTQQQLMTEGKEKTVCAAEFATQKFLDTITDFERHAKGRKDVQSLLVKMLHEKQKQRELVEEKISIISNLTTDTVFTNESAVNEVFFNAVDSTSSFKQNTNGDTSRYSSCSSFSGTVPKKLSKVSTFFDASSCCNENCSAECEKEPPVTKTSSGNIQEERNR